MKQAAVTTDSGLTGEFTQYKADFDRDGVVLVPGFLAKDDLDELRDNLARYIRDVVPALEDGSAIFHDRSKPETLRMLEHLTIDPFFARYASHPRWMALAEALIGEPPAPAGADDWNPWGWQTWHDCPPNTGFYTPPHQDNAYYRFDPPGLAIWVALDRVDEHNGCMRYTRGSHRKPLRRHVVGKSFEGFSQMAEDFGPEDLANEIFFTLDPGDAAVHHGGTIHRTEVNVTADRYRPAFVLIFRAASAQRDPEAYRQYVADLELHKELTTSQEDHTA